MPKLDVVFSEVTSKNVEQLRVLNTAIFPVSYNDDFYTKVTKVMKLAQYALYNDTPIGAVAGRIEEDPETKEKSRLYIMTLGVLEPYRNLSVGNQLLEYLINISESAKEFKQLKTIVLHVHTANDKALAFYARHGFTIVGRMENYYQNLDPSDCHILHRSVNIPVPAGQSVADDSVRLPAIGTKERDDRARKAGVPVDADDAKLLAAEHGTRLPDGHVVTITKDDLPSEDEDEAETAGDMGDFAASIGGADDY